MAALQLDLVGERLQPRVGRHQQVAHLAARPRGGADEATDHLAEEELGPGRRRIDADPQAGDVDALRDHQDRDQPASIGGGEIGDAPAGAGLVAHHQLGLLPRDRPEPRRDRPRVILVGGDDQAARVRVPVGAHLAQPGVAVAQHLAHPLALRAERRPQAPGRLRRRQDEVEVGAAQPTVREPLHLAVIGQEGDRAADPVDQRLRIAVDVVGPAEAVLVVGDPGNRRVVGAEGRAREEQPEAGAVEGLAGLQAPGGQIAHVVRLVGDQQGRPAAGGQPVRIRPGRDRLVGDGDAVEVGRLRPVRVRPVRLEVDAVAARVGGPLAADVGGRAGDDDARDEPGAQHPVGDVQAEGGLAGRRRRRGQEAGGRVRPHGLGRLLLPGAEGSGIGPIRKRSGTRPAAGRVLRGVVQGRATIGSPAAEGLHHLQTYS